MRRSQDNWEHYNQIRAAIIRRHVMAEAKRRAENRRAYAERGKVPPETPVVPKENAARQHMYKRRITLAKFSILGDR